MSFDGRGGCPVKYQALEYVMDQLDIEVFSVSDIGSQEALESIYIKREEINDLSGFEPQGIERSNPSRAIESSKSVIAIAVPYQIKNPRTSGTPRGFITNMAWEFDYHHVVKEKLTQIREALLQSNPDGQILMAVDTGPINDRMTAFGAGLGWTGRNQFIIDKRIGTGFYLGIIITDFTIEGSKTWRSGLDIRCGDCYKCQSSCPGNALTGSNDFHAQKCISTLTQLKRDLSFSERYRIGRSLYGCDICQWACPHNNQISMIADELRRKTANIIEPFDLLELSNKAFKREYGHMGFAWRGLKTLKRNALIVIGNDRRDADYPELLATYNGLTLYHKPYALYALMMLRPKETMHYFKELDENCFNDLNKEQVFNELTKIEEWMRNKFRNGKPIMREPWE